MSTSVSAPHAVPFLDVLDPKFDFGSPEVAQAQAASWYAHSPIGMLVLRYAEGQELLRDPRMDHNGERFMESNGIVDGPIYDWFVPMIVNIDGDDHRRIRGLVHRAFTPRTVSNLGPFIRAIVEGLIDRLRTVETCEFIEDFADSLPLAVMTQLLGVPEEDFDAFRRWTADIALVFSLANGGDIPARVEAAVVALNEYADSLIRSKTAAPGDDLVSALIAAQQVEHRVSEEELRNLLVTLVFAAHESTRLQLANAMVAFAEHHDQWQLLASHPELADQAVEEVIRWRPTATNLYRFAAVDFDYQGVHLPKETFVMVCIAPAQRDPRVFERGDVFDITIPRQPPLQFGGGPHYCLGAALARTELREALPALASRLGPPSIAGPLSWRPPIGTQGPYTLPLRFG